MTPEYIAIRERFLHDGPFRSGDRLTAMQRDVLGVLRVAGQPLSLRDLYEIMEGIERSWIGFERSGLARALRIVEKKGLVVRVPVQRIKIADPAFLWRVPVDVARREALVPVARAMPGVGPKTGRTRAKRRPFKREPQTCVLCRVKFHAPKRRRFCSEHCKGFGDQRSGLLTVEQRQAFDDLFAAQTLERSREDRSWGERPAGSQSPSFAYSLDAQWYGDDSNATLGDILTSREDFTAMSEIEEIMKSNGSNTRALGRGTVRIVRGYHEHEEAA
jgi:hypothetical protein